MAKKMKKILKCIIICALPGLSGIAQSSSPGEVVKKVADNVVENTIYKILNTETGELFDGTAGLPVSGEYKLASPYHDWQYWNGVLAMAFMDLSNYTGEERYADWVRKNYSFTFENLEYFDKQYQTGLRRTSLRQFFRMSLLDHCGAMGAGLADLYRDTPRPEYLEYLEKAADYVIRKELRLEDGTFVRVKPRIMTLWADDLYMSVPFLARMGVLKNDSLFFEEAIGQVRNFRKYLFDESKQIYYHCWYQDNQQNGVAHWGRCNGWVMMALVELLDHLPEDHSGRQEIVGYLQEHITGISRYQSNQGLWHQLLDKPDSYLESSASAMFIYATARAVNMGWIQPGYAAIAKKGWEALEKNVNEKGEVEDICVGTGISDNISYYYNRPVLLNDIHGLGAVIMAGLEMSRLEEKDIN